MSYTNITPTGSPRRSFIPRSPLPPTPPTPASINSHSPLVSPLKSAYNINHEESIFDLVWDRTCTFGDNTISPNDLFKLLRFLEIELTPDAHNHFLTNDTIIKQRILEQVHRDNKEITKDRAFDIITQCLYDVKIVDLDRGIVIGKTKKLDRLQLYHDNYNQQYCNLENEITSIKQKNDQDMKDLRALIQNNDNMIDRIGNIREELIDLSGEFNQYKENRGYDPLYFERLKSGTFSPYPTNQTIIDQDKQFHKVLQNKHRAQRVKSLSGLPITEKVKENRRSFYGIMSRSDRLNQIDENVNPTDISSASTHATDSVSNDLKDHSDIPSPGDTGGEVYIPIEDSSQKLNSDITVVSGTETTESSIRNSIVSILPVTVSSDDEDVVLEIELKTNGPNGIDSIGQKQRKEVIDNNLELNGDNNKRVSTELTVEDISNEERTTFWLAIALLILIIACMT
ncbi:hypothetical protein JA1_005267 [Spathaspora sp. JA1]|nr:hypothetical protein JA1_005267 [Spathaspora sp. JA1]